MEFAILVRRLYIYIYIESGCSTPTITEQLIQESVNHYLWLVKKFPHIWKNSQIEIRLCGQTHYGPPSAWLTFDHVLLNSRSDSPPSRGLESTDALFVFSYTITTTTSTSKTRETSTPSSPTEKTPRKTSSARSHLRARSPWEKWMIEKAKDIREQQKLEAQRLEEKRREEEKKLQEKKKKEAKVSWRSSRTPSWMSAS